jgi:hypothetical protein
MHSPLQVQIVEVEDQLRTAMLCADVAALNQLLAPDLIFTNHLGQLLGKEDDLAAYRSGGRSSRMSRSMSWRLIDLNATNCRASMAAM